MTKWPKDTQAELIAFYGMPKSATLEAQLVDVVPPFKMYYEGKGSPIKSFKFHKKAAAAITDALNEIWSAYGKDQAKVDAARVSFYDGTYVPRYIAGTTRWSSHAFGMAIDIDGEHNGFNTGHGTMPKIVVDAFKRQGARWGGDYHGRTDPMHFEFVDAGTGVVALGSGAKEIVTPPIEEELELLQVRQGDRGPLVKKLQVLLNAFGAQLIADGVFGKVTEGWVKKFQRDHDLHEDGIVGSLTWQLLVKGT